MHIHTTYKWHKPGPPKVCFMKVEGFYVHKTHQKVHKKASLWGSWNILWFYFKRSMEKPALQHINSQHPRHLEGPTPSLWPEDEGFPGDAIWARREPGVWSGLLGSGWVLEAQRLGKRWKTTRKNRRSKNPLEITRLELLQFCHGLILNPFSPFDFEGCWTRSNSPSFHKDQQKTGGVFPPKNGDLRRL